MRILRSCLLTAAVLLGPWVGTVAAQDTPLASVPVSRAELPRVYRLDGVAEAINRSTVSAQTSGRVIEVNFDVDDYVRQGDVLVRLEDHEQRAGVSQAEANLRAAIAKAQDADQEFERVSGAFAKGALPKADMDRAGAGRKQARAGVAAAEAALLQARQQLDYSEIRAPYNGIVTERLIEIGETAQPGRKLMSGLSLDSIRIVVDVPQNLVESIRESGRAQARIGGKWVAASEVTVFPVADPRSDTFKVRLTLPEGTRGVFPGMYVKAGFVIGTQRSLVIPLAAVVLRSEIVGVYVVGADGAVSFRHVRLGSPAGPDHVSVLTGLSEGEMVATDPVVAAITLKQQRTAQVSDE